jgi:hypothetical protein
MSGACSDLPEQHAIMPRNVPVSFSSISSSPNAAVGPAARRLVVNVAMKRSPSTS